MSSEWFLHAFKLCTNRSAHASTFLSLVNEENLLMSHELTGVMMLQVALISSPSQAGVSTGGGGGREVGS